MDTKTLYIASGVVATVIILGIKLMATVVNSTVAFLLGV